MCPLHDWRACRADDEISFHSMSKDNRGLLAHSFPSAGLSPHSRFLSPGAPPPSCITQFCILPTLKFSVGFCLSPPRSECCLFKLIQKTLFFLKCDCNPACRSTAPTGNNVEICRLIIIGLSCSQITEWVKNLKIQIISVQKSKELGLKSLNPVA